MIGTATLAREARAAFVIIDTTGLVHESGRILKNYKIDAVRPDVVVALERRNELAPIRVANRMDRLHFKTAQGCSHSKWMR